MSTDVRFSVVASRAIRSVIDDNSLRHRLRAVRCIAGIFGSPPQCSLTSSFQDMEVPSAADGSQRCTRSNENYRLNGMYKIFL